MIFREMKKNTGYVALIFSLTAGSCLVKAENPFLRPGSQTAKPPSVVRPAPPPPPPRPLNTNLELRGFFKYDGEWYFSIFDKVKNKGTWLQRGERYDDGKVEVESFNEETEVVKMKGGQILSLKKADNKILPVPSGRPVIKPPSLKKPAVSNKTNPKTGTPQKLNIPPRNPSIPKKP